MELDPIVRGTDPYPHQNVTDPQHWLGKRQVIKKTYKNRQKRADQRRFAWIG